MENGASPKKAGYNGIGPRQTGLKPVRPICCPGLPGRSPHTRCPVPHIQGVLAFTSCPVIHRHRGARSFPATSQYPAALSLRKASQLCLSPLTHALPYHIFAFCLSCGTPCPFSYIWAILNCALSIPFVAAC